MSFSSNTFSTVVQIREPRGVLDGAEASNAVAKGSSEGEIQMIKLNRARDHEFN